MLFKEIVGKFKSKPMFDVPSNTLCLMNAYMLQNGEEMTFNTDGAILFADEKHALESLINTVDENVKGKIISFLTFHFPIKENKEKDIGREYFNEETQAVGIIVQNLIYKIDVVDYRVDVIEWDVNEKTETKKITKLEMSKID